MEILNDEQLNINGNLDCILFTLKRLSTTVKRKNGQNTLGKTMVDDSTLERCTTDTKTTDNGFGNSNISLTSTTTSTSSDSSRSLNSPGLVAYGINTSPQQSKQLTTDALLKHIDMKLSNLEQNESVVSGAFIGVSSIG
jgi:hypothetical protein